MLVNSTKHDNLNIQLLFVSFFLTASFPGKYLNIVDRNLGRETTTASKIIHFIPALSDRMRIL